MNHNASETMPTERPLLGRRGRIEKLRNGSHKLRGRERLRQHDAVWDALGCPLVGFDAAHVNDGKVRVDFPGVPCDIPPVEFSRTQIDVRDERPYLPSAASSNSMAFSPDGVTTVSNPPSLRLSSTTL